MSGSLTIEQTAQVLRSIASLPHAPSDVLDGLVEEIATEIVDCSYVYDEGLEAARALRRHLGIESTVRVEPKEILEQLGVPVHVISVARAEALEAFAVWGPRRGPAVFVNDVGRRAKDGRRVTLAHELCHLLLDRDGALPVGDVMRGREPGHIEARARAFAAELLLPQQVAGEEYAAWSGDAKKLARRLGRRYGVSLEMVAWNIRNSGVAIEPEDRAALRTLIGAPWRREY
jgi:Zn-dependent peptidase ImmA (M78 family)